MTEYLNYIIEQAKNLLSIDSPSGYTKDVTEYLTKEFQRLGYQPVYTVKGGVLVDLGPTNVSGGVCLESHVDTLGAMVAKIKDNGRLLLTPVGGLNANNIEGENCRIITRFSGSYQGTCQLADASIHVNGSYNETTRSFQSVEVLVDEKTSSKEETLKLGIQVGDYVCLRPRTVITPSGYIKSRFLDDKLSTAILLGYAYYLKKENLLPSRRVYQHITVFEEVGHGGSASIPSDVTEVISVDMGCVGDGLDCTEHQVSICAKDSRGPYHYDVVTGLIEAARSCKADYAVDVYPFYGSDADAALTAGYDIRHGLIGPGVYASHGYERSHVDGVKNTLELLKVYLR